MQQGQMLAHFRVEEKIGAGGMGEVYRAHDTTLSRDVALKILPPEFAADSDRMARFQREAKMLALLHHPNIASIFGFESTPECTFLIMELVDGDDLSEVIKRGALPVDEAVEIARQIAEGLEEAHEKGIIHRDLKPANVKRTPDGKVKVLDFGLARAFAGQTAGEEQVNSAPTMTAAMTQAGTVLGTAAYMSPEQARGFEVDRRTDIWAFGVILFEMLTGDQLFAGETASDTLADILKTDPDWKDLPDDLPLQVERVVRRCLLKDPRQRLRDIGEARVRLEDPAAESGVFTGAIAAANLPVENSTRKRSLNVLPWGLFLVALCAAGWFAIGRGDSGRDRPVQHLAIPSPAEADFAVSGSYPGLPVISPDGTHMVFSAKSVADGLIRLHVRAISSGKAVAMDGTENAQYPFWSPDNQWIAFFDRNEGLKKIMVGGGPAQPICAAGNGKGGSWNEAGEIIFTPEYNSNLQVVAAVGGEPTDVTELAAEEGVDSHRHPQFLPDGRRFIFLARGAGGRDSELRLASLDGGPHRVLMDLSTMAQYASGYLLFLNHQTLMSQPFDPVTATLSGAPIPVAEDVMVINGAAKGAFAASNEGTLVYLQGKANMEASLVWLDRKGNEMGQVSDLSDYDTIALSPDNRRAAVTIIDSQAGTHDIWIVEIERNFRTRFTNDPADENFPVWHPDGRALFFVSDRTGEYAIYRQELGHTGEEELVFQLESPVFLWDVAGDGRTILYSTPSDGSGLDLWSADLSGETEPRLVRSTAADDGAANFSPDNRWIAFWSEESGEGQVYLAPWPAMTTITQVSTTSGGWSFWHPNGRELIYQDQGGRLLATPLTPEGDELVIGLPTPLFDHAALKLEGAWLDLAADGERFLAVDSDASDPPPFCDIVINWPARIQRP
jgi:eukaryotic-like serine/threonine-protein kinase